MMHRTVNCDSAHCREILMKAIMESTHPGLPLGERFQPTSVMALFTSASAQALMGDPELIFIQKADIEGYPWRNQMAFPGGHWDPGDSSRGATAIRELKEEMAISSSDVDFIGSIGHFLTLKSKEIEAFVGIWKENEEIVFDTSEISRVFRIPLTHLMKIHHTSGYSGCYPDIMELTYPYEDVVIWGVTAKIVHHLLEILIPFTAPSGAFLSFCR